MDEAWMEFVATGRVSAYLQYRNADAVRVKQADVRNPQEERPDGTEYRSDRDGLTGHADWRI